MAKSTTKAVIRDNFIELLEEYCFDKISVRMVAEKSEVNRNTFYYHYRDTFELLQDVIDSALLPFFNDQIDSENFASIDRFSGTMKKYRKGIYNVIHSSAKDLLYTRIKDNIAKAFNRVAAVDVEHYGISDFDSMMIVRLHVDALTCIITSWLENDVLIRIDTTINSLQKIIRATYKSALIACATKNVDSYNNNIL